MTLRLSTGTQNFLAKEGSIDDALNQGILVLFSGAQPASADAAETGTRLCVITDNAQARTAEVLATGTVTLAGTAGSVNAVTVNGIDVLGGAVPFNGTLNQTAIDVATQINRNKTMPDYTASASNGVVTITAARGTGATPNGFVVSATLTTLTATYANMAGGVAAANGLKFDVASGGSMAQRAGQVWSGVNLADGVAGWFRFYGSVADAGALDTTGTAIRIDGAISTAGAELNLNNTSLKNGATTKISTTTATVPGQ